MLQNVTFMMSKMGDVSGRLGDFEKRHKLRGMLLAGLCRIDPVLLLC